MIAHLRRWSPRIVAALAAVTFAYGLAGAIGGLIPRNAGAVQPRDGITIWIEDNGIHTGLVLPKVAAGIDWGQDFPASDLDDPRYAALDHVAIGWGERGFYLGTPTWWDVRPDTLLNAAFGSDDTLLHVEHLPRPAAGDSSRPIVLSVLAYRRLAATIRSSRARGSAIHGYFAYDAFYPATGRYTALNTCNTWTGDTLASAGIRVGSWTPFPSTVMRWF